MSVCVDQKRRGTKDWNREKLPIGTIRIRRRRNGRRVQMIKVRDAGPKSRRWMNYARHWWLNNRGPIPDGMRVVHYDGDTLNDDPENYKLMTAGDVAFMAREWDSTLDERNAIACGEAMKECNRLRSRITRFLRYLPSRWYLVDLRRRRVINEPYRSRSALLRAFRGRDLPRNGGAICGYWLGWSGLSAIDACVLAVLADRERMELPRVQTAVVDLRKLNCWPSRQPGLGSLRSAVSRLRRAGFVDSFRIPGRSRHQYGITDKAIAERRNPLGYVAARGSDIEDRFPGFAKVFPEEIQHH